MLTAAAICRPDLRRRDCGGTAGRLRRRRQRRRRCCTTTAGRLTSRPTSRPTRGAATPEKGHEKPRGGALCLQAVATTTDKPPEKRRRQAFCPLISPFTRAAARIYASTRKRTRKRNAYTHATHAQARTHGATRNATRTDGAQHVTKPPTRGQIRVLWSKSINDATAALPLKIGALQAAKRASGATRAHTRAKGARRQPQKGGKMYDGGDG